MTRLLFIAVLFTVRNAWGCGYCVEDKVASAYDHAVVSRAVGAGHHVAFFHIDGPQAQAEATKRALAAAADAVPGIDKGSVRVVPATLTLSYAFDPRRTSLAASQAALEKKLASRRLSLFPMRVIERAGELKEAAVR
jgi:hypothetical protein